MYNELAPLTDSGKLKVKQMQLKQAETMLKSDTLDQLTREMLEELVTTLRAELYKK